MTTTNRRGEKGVALVLSILALLLLTAIAAGMMYMSTTESSVNNNFKQEERAYFAARAGWYTTTQSVAPYPLDYKWVRVTLKSNNSSAYPVDGNVNNAAKVCWDGTSERALTAASCAAMNPVANPVYLVTALAVSRNGARRMIQQEIAQTPTTGQPGGLFATGAGCGALTFGGNAKTHSFNSATEGTPANPPNNAANSNGDIG